MQTLIWIIAITILNGLTALVGAVYLLLNEKLFNRVLLLLVAFSAGALLAGSLLHILPEALETTSTDLVFILSISGFILFFLIERFLHWHHCQGFETCEHKGEKKSFGHLILFGDGVHNFVDGLIIAASFLVSVPFGLSTFFVIITHEIPQEMGDFAILVYSGFSKTKALLYNLFSQLTCVAGGVLGYFLGGEFSKYLLPIAAGGFIYVSASDLVPELKKEESLKKSLAYITAFIAGIILISLL